MTFRFGDIYLANFEPSTGKEYRKVRPALVIQEEGVSRISPYVTVMPLSSRIEAFDVADIFIEKDAKNRLVCDSVIRVHQISSFDKSRFIHFIGMAGSPVARRVRGYLRRHFGF